MKRLIGGMVLVVHGLAHAQVGAWAVSFGDPWLVTPLSVAAIGGFLFAGLGVMGVRALARWWAHAAAGATFASLVLLILFNHPLFIGGLVADIAILTILIRRTRAAAEPTMHL